MPPAARALRRHLCFSSLSLPDIPVHFTHHRPRLRLRRRLTSVVPFESYMAGPDSPHGSAPLLWPPPPVRQQWAAWAADLLSASAPVQSVPGLRSRVGRMTVGGVPGDVILLFYRHGLSPPHHPNDTGSVRVVSGGGHPSVPARLCQSVPSGGDRLAWLCVLGCPPVNSLNSVQAVLFTVCAHTLNTPQCIRVLSQSAGSRLR